MSKQIKLSTILGVLLACMLMFTACGSDSAEQSTETIYENVEQTVASQPTESEYAETESDAAELQRKIETEYVQLSYSAKYQDVLIHQEIRSDPVTIEIFSMQAKDKTMELFRIYFGDETMGIMEGYLTVEGTEIPVCYSICQYNNEEFPNEETRALYLETMNCLNEIMHSLRDNSSFSEDKATEPVNVRDAVISYWTFSLPETMEYEELEQAEQYEIRFYGNVAGERIALYTVFLGEPVGSTQLGTYELDGINRIVSVENYPMVPKETWTEESIASYYMMMSTINDVLQVIMSNENFSEQLPE